MAKKKRQPEIKREEAEGGYGLKTDAVDRLVSAHSAEKLPPLKGDPGRQYRRGGFIDRLPAWFKAVFMKFWFNGAVCYFILWGLGLYLTNLENMILVLAAVLGMVTDILVNNALRFFAPTEGANDKWMMLPKKRLVNFFLNILYAFAVLIAVVWLYNSINGVINGLRGTEGVIYLGVEPIAFGLLYVLVDLALIGIKNLFVSIIRDAKRKNGA